MLISSEKVRVKDETGGEWRYTNNYIADSFQQCDGCRANKEFHRLRLKKSLKTNLHHRSPARTTRLAKTPRESHLSGSLLSHPTHTLLK